MHGPDVSIFLVTLAGAGGERVMLDIAEGLTKEGKSVEFVLMRGIGTFISKVPSNVSVEVLGTNRFIGALFALMWYIGRKKPKTILSTSDMTNLVLLLATRFVGANTRVVIRIGVPLSIHFKHYKGFKSWLIPKLTKWFYPKADQIVAVSKGVALDLTKAFGVSEEKISVVYNPKQIAKIKELSKGSVGHPWLSKKESSVIVAMGRLRVQKDFETLLRAFAQVKETKNVQLLILGKGSELEALEQLASELDIEDKVQFVGFVENPYAYIARADVFVLSSLWEGMPSALIETLALGVPVISTDCPFGPREVLAPGSDPSKHVVAGVEYARYGMLVPVLDPQSLAKAISELLSDPTKVATYRREGIKRASDFAFDKGIADYRKALSV